MSTESSSLGERGNLTELYVSWLAKPAADMLSDFIFGFRTSYNIIFRISITRSALSGLWAECDAIPSHSNTNDPERRHTLWSAHISVQLNQPASTRLQTVAYVSLHYYFPTLISVGRHQSHKTIVNNIYGLKDQLLTVPKSRQLPVVIGGKSKPKCFFADQLHYSFTQISGICN